MTLTSAAMSQRERVIVGVARHRPDELLELGEPRVRQLAGGELAARLGEAERERGEELAELVVQLPREPRSLGFLR